MCSIKSLALIIFIFSYLYLLIHNFKTLSLYIFSCVLFGINCITSFSYQCILSTQCFFLWNAMRFRHLSTLFTTASRLYLRFYCTNSLPTSKKFLARTCDNGHLMLFTVYVELFFSQEEMDATKVLIKISSQNTLFVGRTV